MKNLLFISVAAALFMAGCSTKTPEVDTSSDTSSVPTVSDVSNTDSLSDAEKLNALISKLQNQVENIYFDFDKYNIRSDMQGVLNTNASLFNQKGAENVKIMIEGNCDEWGSDEYNYALGVRRAKAAKDALVAQGIDANRIEITSNGESKPVCTDKTKACDAQNRRDEFKILP